MLDATQACAVREKRPHHVIELVDVFQPDKMQKCACKLLTGVTKDARKDPDISTAIACHATDAAQKY